MEKSEIERLIAVFSKHGGPGSGVEYNPVEHFIAKLKLIRYGKKILVELNNALQEEDQNIVLEIAEIIGKIGYKESIPFLKEVLKREDLWGMTRLNTNVALIKLGDKLGMDNLKQYIVNRKTDRETRIGAAKALLKLRIKNVFKKNEQIDFTGESMSDDWSNVLKKFVDRLREN